MQESANVDDRHANRPNVEGSSMAQSQPNLEGSSDSIELGLPHEPLSITFFKTAFSITGLGLPRAHLSPLFHAFHFFGIILLGLVSLGCIPSLSHT
jgi:hypothetical protein